MVAHGKEGLIRSTGEGTKRAHERLVWKGKRCHAQCGRARVEQAGGRETVHGGLGNAHAAAKGKSTRQGHALVESMCIWRLEAWRVRMMVWVCTCEGDTRENYTSGGLGKTDIHDSFSTCARHTCEGGLVRELRRQWPREDRHSQWLGHTC
ncbi:hypothetical protein AMTR_s00076p00107490 [Amborella trichopoda]|uniref:Uncharacterized protein n=1 Tax=Amborella trichopoda TaxID=13333 RepID=W1PCD0_AMBTC|nr:hypothetical protein AMTR_s00076p00107490 [Amborella trichopoda]